MDAISSSAPTEPELKRHRRTFRLVRAAWRLVRRDPSVTPLALMLVAFAALTWALFAVAASHLSLGLALSGSHGAATLYLLWVGVVFTVLFISALFSAAIAHAASGAFEGAPLLIREAIAESRDSLGRLLAWSAIGTAAVALAELVVLTGRPGTFLGNLGLAVWAFFTAFVIPLIAIEAAGTGEAMVESATLARRRWGEELVGCFSIAVLWALAAFAGVIVFAAALHPLRAHHGPGAVVFGLLGALGLVMALIYATATTLSFVVALLRLDNRDSTLDDLLFPPASAVRPTPGRRFLGLAICTSAATAAVVLVAHTGLARQNHEYYTHFSTAETASLSAGAPVLFEEQQVGSVVAVRPEGTLTSVAFEVSADLPTEAYGDPVHLEMFDGRVCLGIGSTLPSTASQT